MRAILVSAGASGIGVNVVSAPPGANATSSHLPPSSVASVMLVIACVWFRDVVTAVSVFSATSVVMTNRDSTVTGSVVSVTSSRL